MVFFLSWVCVSIVYVIFDVVGVVCVVVVVVVVAAIVVVGTVDINSSIFFICSLCDPESVQPGQKRWQDVGIAVCVKCPAMPPYCHFFHSYMLQTFLRTFLCLMHFRNASEMSYVLVHTYIFIFREKQRVPDGGAWFVPLILHLHICL